MKCPICEPKEPPRYKETDPVPVPCSGMHMTEEYNGWSNRETWAANLHMTNDPGWDEAMRDAVIESHLGGDAKYATADVIKGVFEEVVDGDIAFEVVEMILRDVGSMWRINWVEIAEVQLSGLEEGASREPTSGLR